MPDPTPAVDPAAAAPAAATPAATPAAAAPDPTPAAPTPDAPETLADLALKIQPQSTDPSQQTPATQPAEGQDQVVVPDPGQGDGTGDPAKPTDAKPDPGQVAEEVKDADILTNMGTQETPEATNARLQRDFGASQKEAMRMKKAIEGYESALEKQGLAVGFDEATGESTGVYATDKYNGGNSDAEAPKFSSLSEAQQTAMETDQDALMAFAYGRGKDAMTRIAPTVEKPIESISPEKETAVVKHMLSQVLDDGETKKYPNLEKNMGLIRQTLDMPYNKPLRAAFNAAPDTVLGLINASVDSTRSQLAQQAQLIIDAKKTEEQEAKDTPSPAPSLGGQPTIAPTGKAAERQTALEDAIRSIK